MEGKDAPGRDDLNQAEEQLLMAALRMNLISIH
jgi:hypothetical protein